MTRNYKIIAALILCVFVVAAILYISTRNNREKNVSSSANLNTNNTNQTQLKTFRNDELKFSFMYPSKYQYGSTKGVNDVEVKGFWLEDRFARRDMNISGEDCGDCYVPDLQVSAAKTDKSLEQFIEEDLELDENEKSAWPFEKVTIGGNDFTKVFFGDLFSTTGYYTKKNDVVVGFLVNWVEQDNEELKSIIETLKFE